MTTSGIAFPTQSWDGYPLTAEKFAGWLAGNTDPVVLLALDYETLGEHMGADTGIFDFLAALPEQTAQFPQLEWATPGQAIARIAPSGQVDVPTYSTISWADQERDTSAWLGNEMQQFCFEEIKRLEPLVRATGNADCLHTWRLMQSQRPPALHLRQGDERRQRASILLGLRHRRGGIRPPPYGAVRSEAAGGRV